MRELLVLFQKCIEFYHKNRMDVHDNLSGPQLGSSPEGKTFVYIFLFEPHSFEFGPQRPKPKLRSWIWAPGAKMPKSIKTKSIGTYIDFNDRNNKRIRIYDTGVMWEEEEEEEKELGVGGVN